MSLLNWLSRPNRRPNRRSRSPRRQDRLDRSAFIAELGLTRLEDRRVLNADFSLVGHDSLEMNHFEGTATQVTAQETVTHYEFVLDRGAWMGTDGDGVTAAGNTLSVAKSIITGDITLDDTAAGADVNVVIKNGDIAVSLIDTLEIDGVGDVDLHTEPATEIVFIDSQVDDYETLIEGVSDNAEIVVLNANEDGVEQIAQHLESREDIAAIHIVSHGDSGVLLLGSSTLTNDNLDGYLDELANIGDSLTEDGDVLIYGCNVAEGDRGSEFVESLAAAADADVAASIDYTGARDQGGNWDLEAEVGLLESQVVVSASAQASYAHVLVANTSAITISGTASDDVLTVAHDGANVTYQLNTDPAVAIPTGARLQFDAGDGDDELIVDYSNGIFDNALTYNGGGQTTSPNGDKLTVVGGAFTTITKTYTGVNSGNVDLDGETITYSGLEPVLLNVGTVANIIFNLPAGPTTDAVIADDGSTADPDATNDANTSSLNGSTFEFTEFTNPTTSLTVNLGNAGDTITVQDMDDLFGPTGGTPFTINGGTGVDIFNVKSTRHADGTAYSNAAGLTINAGTGADTVNVSSDAATNMGNVDGIVSPLTVNGDGDADILNVSDFGGTADAAGMLSATTITALGNAGAITYGTIETLNLDLSDAAGGDTLTVTATHAGATTIDANGGGDTINVQATAGTTTVNAGAGTDTVNISSDAATNSGNLDGIAAALTVNGDGDADILNVSDFGGTADAAGMLSATTITALGNAGAITYGTIETLNLDLSDAAGGDTLTVTATHAGATTIDANGGGDTINVQATAGTTTVNAGAGTDTVNISSDAATNSGNLDGIAAALTVNGDGDADILNVSDFGGTADAAGMLSATTITALGNAGAITYGTIETLNLDLSDAAGGDTLTVTATHAGATTIDANGGGDTINVQATAGTTTVNAGAGTDTVNISSDAATNSGDLDGIAAALTVNGDGDADILNVSDFGGTADAAGMLSATTITALGNAGAITYGTIETLNLDLSDAAGGDTLTVTATHAGATTIDANGGTDTINVQATAGTTTVNAGAGTDTVNVSSDAATNSGNLDGIAAALTVNGDGDADILNVSDFGGTADAAGMLSATTITALGNAGAITYGTIETLNLDLSDAAGGDTLTVTATHAGATTIDANGGTDTINVQATAGTTTVNAGAGTDTVNVSSDAATNSGNLDGIAAALTVNGDDHDAGTVDLTIKGDTNMVDTGDALNISDEGSAAANNYTLTDTTFTRTAAAMTGTITYMTVETLNIETGVGMAVVNVTTTAAGINTNITTQDAMDDIDVATTGTDSNVIINTAAGMDTIDINGTGGIGAPDAGLAGAGSFLQVNAGDDGDTIALNASDNSSRIELYGDAGDDTFNVLATAATVATAVIGGGNSDTLNFDGAGGTTGNYDSDAATVGAGMVSVDTESLMFFTLESVRFFNVDDLTVTTPNSADVITLAAGTGVGGVDALDVSGTSGGVAITPLTVFDVPSFTLDTAANDGAGADMVTAMGGLDEGGAGDLAQGLTNITILTGADGTTNIDATIDVPGAVAIQESAIVGINESITAGTSLTIEHMTPPAAMVDLAESKNLTAKGGDLSVFSGIGSINLSGADFTTNMITAVANFTVQLADVTSTNNPNLIVRSGGGATVDGVDVGTGTLEMTTDTDGDGSENLMTTGAITGGSITMTTDLIDIGGSVTGTTLVLQPRLVAQAIGIGGGAGGFNLSDAEIALLTDGFTTITIGRLADGVGAVDVDAVTFSDNLTIVGGLIAVTGLDAVANDVTLTARTGAITDADGAAVTDVTGGAVALNAATGIGGPSAPTEDAAIDVDADSITAINSMSIGIFLNAVGTGGVPIIAQALIGGHIFIVGGEMVTLDDVDTAAGDISSTITSAGIVANNVTADSGGSIDLTTLTAGSISVTELVHAKGGGHVTIDSVEDVTVKDGPNPFEIVVKGAAKITIDADPLGLNGGLIDIKDGAVLKSGTGRASVFPTTFNVMLLDPGQVLVPGDTTAVFVGDFMSIAPADNFTIVITWEDGTVVTVGVDPYQLRNITDPTPPDPGSADVDYFEVISSATSSTVTVTSAAGTPDEARFRVSHTFSVPFLATLMGSVTGSFVLFNDRNIDLDDSRVEDLNELTVPVSVRVGSALIKTGLALPAVRRTPVAFEAQASVSPQQNTEPALQAADPNESLPIGTDTTEDENRYIVLVKMRATGDEEWRQKLEGFSLSNLIQLFEYLKGKSLPDGIYRIILVDRNSERPVLDLQKAQNSFRDPIKEPGPGSQAPQNDNSNDSPAIENDTEKKVGGVDSGMLHVVRVDEAQTHSPSHHLPVADVPLPAGMSVDAQADPAAEPFSNPDSDRQTSQHTSTWPGVLAGSAAALAMRRANVRRHSRLSDNAVDNSPRRFGKAARLARRVQRQFLRNGQSNGRDNP